MGIQLTKAFNILSLAGGGSRGLFQACFLERLQADEALSELEFDLIVGTSTGSITAAALATGRSAREVRNLFESHLHQIFPDRGIGLFLKALTNTGPLFERGVLEAVIGAAFKNQRLSDARTTLLINSTTLERFEPKTFSSEERAQGSDLRIVDAVVASCAAPLFFSPHTIEENDTNYLDGGLWANSPAKVGVDYAINHLGVPKQLVRVLSLGTGEAAAGATLREIESGRQVGVAAVLRVLEMYSNSQSMRSLDSLAETIGSENVLHVSPTLQSPIGLHDAERSLEVLPGLAQSEFERARAKLVELFLEDLPEDSVYYDRSGLISDEMVFMSGLSRFMPKRRYYQKYRHGSGDIESYLDSAQHSIEMISINLATGNFIEDVCRVITRKLEQPAFQVRISLLDPEDDDLMNMISVVFARERDESEPQKLSESISRSMAKLVSIRESLDEHQRSRFVLGYHRSLPFGSAIILDDGFSSARLQIETKAYKAPMSDSFAFELVPSNEEALYHTLLFSFRKLMGDGRTC